MSTSRSLRLGLILQLEKDSSQARPMLAKIAELRSFVSIPHRMLVIISEQEPTRRIDDNALAKSWISLLPQESTLEDHQRVLKDFLSSVSHVVCLSPHEFDCLELLEQMWSRAASDPSHARVLHRTSSTNVTSVRSMRPLALLDMFRKRSRFSAHPISIVPVGVVSGLRDLYTDSVLNRTDIEKIVDEEAVLLSDRRSTQTKTMAKEKDVEVSLS